MGVVSAAAFAVGATAVPTPITEEAWDGWFYHRYFSILGSGAIATAPINSRSGAVRIEVDSKAMRKLEVDMVLYAALEVTEVGVASMEFSFNSRLLVKLA